jgi:hypothetical protein
MIGMPLGVTEVIVGPDASIGAHHLPAKEITET